MKKILLCSLLIVISIFTSIGIVTVSTVGDFAPIASAISDMELCVIGCASDAMNASDHVTVRKILFSICMAEEC